MFKIKINPLWNKSVLFITFSFLIILSSYVLTKPNESAKFFKSIYDYFSINFESYFLIIGFIILLILIIIACLPIGSKRLHLEGKDTFSYFSWGSMLFATGLGAALLYWSTIEWTMYLPKSVDDTNVQGIDMLKARAYPHFHWGFTGWAIYCLPAIAFAIALINKPNSPLTFSGILLKRQSGPFRIILDLFFIGAILTGAGVGLTLSFPLISAVISKIFMIDKNIYLDFLALLVCLIIFGSSVYLGQLAGKQVIDLCAAPGGKTAQLIAAGADVTAIDSNRKRLDRLRRNLKRLNMPSKLVLSDGRSFVPETPVDAVLLDAPCSATGTIRRRPDILGRRSSADISSLQTIQWELATTALGWLKPGGQMIYATCSLQPEEGEDIIAAILEAADGRYQLAPITSAEAGLFGRSITENGCLRILPSSYADIGGVDGFFIARLMSIA